jgi:hypothetical protein
MTQIATTQPSRTRLITFRVVTGLVLLLFLPSLLGAVVPWWHIDYQSDGVIEPWRDAIEGTVDAVLWLALLGAWLRPLARPLLMQYVLIVAVVAAIVIPAAGPAMLFTLVPLLLTAVSFPDWSLLWDVRLGEVNRLLTTVCVLAAAVLAVIALRHWSGSVSSGATYAEHLLLIGVAGLLTSTARPGWRWLGICVGLAWLYIAVVALTHGSDPQVFAPAGAVSALAIGAVILVFTLRVRSGASATNPDPARLSRDHA